MHGKGGLMVIMEFGSSDGRKLGACSCSSSLCPRLSVWDKGRVWDKLHLLELEVTMT
jgi:hypothetical protein